MELIYAPHMHTMLLQFVRIKPTLSHEHVATSLHCITLVEAESAVHALAHAPSLGFRAQPQECCPGPAP